MTPRARHAIPSGDILRALRAVRANQTIEVTMAQELRARGLIETTPQGARLRILTRAGERLLEGRHHAQR